MPRVRIGEPVARKEDFRLVTGHGTYADDIELPGMAYAAFVRSPHAHARIVSIDTEAAKAMPGVLAVVTAADTRALNSIPHMTGSSKGGSDVGLANRDGSERLVTPHAPIQAEVVRFAGELVAMVVAESHEEARDAAEQVMVEWEPLPAVTATPEAIKPSAPELWPEVPHNLALDAQIGDGAATDAAFAKAAHKVKLTTWVQRVTGVHMEPRTAIGVFDQETQRYVLYACGGIGVTRLRVELSTVLGVPLERTRVITPQDVGGNFGTRNAFHPEFALLPWMAERLGRPVKHLVERSEAFISDYQGRDLFVEAELALDAEGRFLAIKSSNLSNVGAHTASFVPLNKGVQLMTSVYAIPAAHIRARAVLSNTPSTIPYRSAGRPEAIFVIERLIDLAAQEGGFDRIELRRKNLIAPEAMPYKNAFGITYDNGNYADTMMATVEAADWAGFPARRAEAARRGKLLGIGVANYVETAGGMPRERADIVVSPEGRVDAVLGTAPTGQSHETTFAQLMSDWLGVDFDEVTVRFGDTDIVHAGGGSHSGRSMRFASIVIKAATDEIIAKGKEIAAARLEVAAADIEFADGRFVVAGTDRGMTLYEAAAAAEKGEGLPAPLRGRLAATSDQMIGGLAFPFGSHVCEVEIDPETGRLTVVRHTCIDDVGRAVNPMVVEGQSHGGIVQGMGQALMEQCVMDPETGQPLAGSFMDYEIPRADEFPMMDARFAELPATSHPLGLRPGGEGGTTPALAVAINAVVDALSPLGVTHFEMPATPYRIWRVIQDAKARPSPKG